MSVTYNIDSIEIINGFVVEIDENGNETSKTEGNNLQKRYTVTFTDGTNNITKTLIVSNNDNSDATIDKKCQLHMNFLETEVWSS
jgi:hypothetical protein